MMALWSRAVGWQSRLALGMNHRFYPAAPRTFDNTQHLKDCYKVLGVSADCDDVDLKEAYVKKAKEYHPDSGSDKADPEGFSKVENAYRNIRAHRKETERGTKDEADHKVFNIQHTAPQHREYLSYEGVGYGTPSQRQKQYQQHKVNRAFESVSEHRIKKISAKYETNLMKDDPYLKQQVVLKNSMDRIVEDLISESMAQGHFDNLSGKGKPLKYTEHNPFVDSMTHNLNKVLIQDGYAPQWIMLEKDIRQGIKAARKKLEKNRIRVGPEPLKTVHKRHWDSCITEFKETVNALNKKIRDYNLIVPSLRQQMTQYNTNKEINKILETYNDKASRGELEELESVEEIHIRDSHVKINQQSMEGTSLRDVWREVKALFK